MIKKIIFSSTLLFSSSVLATSYGEDFAMPKGGGMTVAEAIQDLAQSKEQKLNDVGVVGEIAQVCQSKGCWVTLKADSSKGADSCEEALKGAKTQSELRVMFKGHSFKVPKDLKGKVLVMGNLKKKKMSKFQIKHFLKDANCSKDQIKKVKGGLYQYQMTATGLQTL